MSEEVTAAEITRETCYVPATHQGKGRRTAVAPGATAMRYLHYGRITLAPEDAAVTFANADHERPTLHISQRQSSMKRMSFTQWTDCSSREQ